MAGMDSTNPKPNPAPNYRANPSGAAINIEVTGNAGKSPPRFNLVSSQEFIESVASSVASQPLLHSNAKVWGVLTAISYNVKCPQGLNVLLMFDEHVIGRSVVDASFPISSHHVSPKQCKIYRKRVTTEDVHHQSKFNHSVFLKDTSTSGTYLNWKKLMFDSPESKLHHGDIISFAGSPQNEHAFAFVFREVLKLHSVADVLPLKRKAEVEFGSESKRLEGIMVGASEGPTYLSNFRGPLLSHTELLKQLEDQAVNTELLGNKNLAAIESHEKEKKDIRESVSNPCLDHIKEMPHVLMEKDRDVMEINRMSADQKDATIYLKERLSASMQSCTETNETDSQKGSISELNALLDEQRDQRKEEIGMAAANLKASIQEVQTVAEEGLKRLSDASSKPENEKQEIMNKLQEKIDMKESVSKSCIDLPNELQQMPMGAQKEAMKVNIISACEIHSQEDRVGELADEIIHQKASESKLQALLDAERAKRKGEKAYISALKAQLHKVIARCKAEKAYISALEAQLSEESARRKEDSVSIIELKAQLDEERAWRKEDSASIIKLKAQLDEERARRKEDQASTSELKAQLNEERARRKEDQASISKLNALLDEERAQRKEEQEKAAVNLEASTQRARAKAQEELKRLCDATFGFFDLGICMASNLPSDEC